MRADQGTREFPRVTAAETAACCLSQPAEDPHVVAQRTEKERMAAMLFGGVSAGGGEAKPPGPRGTRDTPPSYKPRVSASSASSVNVLSDARSPSQGPAGRSGVSGAAPAASATTPPAAGPAVDLLDFRSMESSAVNGSGGFGKAGDGGVSAAGLVSATEHHHSSSSVDHLGLDLLGAGARARAGAGAGAGAGQNTVNGSPSLLGTAGAGSLPVDDLLGVGGVSVSAASSSNGVGGRGGGDDLLDGSLGNANLVLPASPQMMAGRSSSGADGGLDLSGLLLGTTAPAPAKEAPQASFGYGGRAMKPLPIATEEFGRRWKGCTGERRWGGNRFPPGLGSPHAVAERLGKRLGVHTVEIIPHTAEGICAGQLEAGGASNLDVCLVHCKVSPWAFGDL